MSIAQFKILCWFSGFMPLRHCHTLVHYKCCLGWCNSLITRLWTIQRLLSRIMSWIFADQQWKYDYGLLKCNHSTCIPLILMIEIADLLELPYIPQQQYIFLSFSARNKSAIGHFSSIWPAKFYLDWPNFPYIFNETAM